MDNRWLTGLVPLFVVSATLTLASPGEDEASRVQACPRQAEQVFPIGNATEVEDGEPPCRIEFSKTGIRLDAVADGSRPDPGRAIVVDSDGRFLSANARGWEASISVWDARGRYLTSFGRPGEGPGELSTLGLLTVFIDDEDQLHVRDGALRWSVFSKDHEFVRSASARAMGGLPRTTVLLDSGAAVASDGRWPDTTHYFRLVDDAGTVRGTFGPIPNGMSARGGRVIAYSGGDTFWAGPPEDAAGYSLEEWGVDGELRRTLRREVAWWQQRGDGETSPVMLQLHITHDGLLYAMVRRPTEEYARAFARAQRRGERMERDRRDAMTEVVVEVIDTLSGELLASEVYSASRAREILPGGLFRGSLRGFRYEVGDAGQPFVDIVSLMLVPR